MMDMRTRKRVANYLGHKNSHRMIKPVLFADNYFLGAIGEDGGMRVWSAALAGMIFLKISLSCFQVYS